MNQERELPRAEHYPPFVGDEESTRRRWDLSVAVAADQLQEPPNSGQVWSAARVIFHSSIPTD